MSLEEENARQHRVALGNEEHNEQTKSSHNIMDVDAQPSGDVEMGEDDEEALLARAIAMSMETAAQEQRNAKDES